MLYLIAASTLGMLGFMLWSVGFRLRRDRVAAERELTRGKFAFRPKERLRFLLNHSFKASAEKAEWENSLISSLTDIPSERDKRVQ